MLLEHGHDPAPGNRPIAVPQVLREDATGAYFEGDLLDGVPPMIVDGLRHNLYGASFRFAVHEKGDTWVTPRTATEHNRERLPERTLTSVDCREFGPVTFPAYEGVALTVT